MLYPGVRLSGSEIRFSYFRQKLPRARDQRQHNGWRRVHRRAHRRAHKWLDDVEARKRAVKKQKKRKLEKKKVKKKNKKRKGT